SPMNYITAEQAVSHVKSGNRIFFQGAAMTPKYLIETLCKNYKQLQDVEIVQMHTEGEALYTQEPYNDSFFTNSCFVGGNVRRVINSDRGAYTPIFLSEMHKLFKLNILALDVAFIQVSPPDKHGYCSLGTSIDVTVTAIQTAKKVIAQVNPNVPRTHGDGIIHIKNIDAAVWTETPIHNVEPSEPTEIEKKIGYHVAQLVEDGATLQMGIGG